MNSKGPKIKVSDALELIARVEARAELSHLQVKKYRNFLLVYTATAELSRRRARLALQEDARWQLHLPISRDEWEPTRLIAPFGEMMHALVHTYGDQLGQGSEALRAALIRDRWMGCA